MPFTRLVPALLTSLACVAVPAAAQEREAAPSREPQRWEFARGLHAGTPAVVSLVAGVSRTVASTPEGWQDVFLVAEPGIAAGRVSLGYARVRGSLAGGYSVRASLLRRWNESPVDYAGAEVSLQALLVGPRVGIFHRIGGGSTEGLRFTIDLALGY